MSSSHTTVTRRIRPVATDFARAVALRQTRQANAILNQLDTADLHGLAHMLARYVDTKRMLDDQPTPASHFEPIAQACLLAAPRFETSVDEIRSKARPRNVTEARMVAAYAARLTGMTFVAIGQYLGKDHTTVINAVVQVGERPRLRRMALEVARQIGWDRDDPDDRLSEVPTEGDAA